MWNQWPLGSHRAAASGPLDHLHHLTVCSPEPPSNLPSATICATLEAVWGQIPWRMSLETLRPLRMMRNGMSSPKSFFLLSNYSTPRDLDQCLSITEMLTFFTTFWHFLNPPIKERGTESQATKLVSWCGSECTLIAHFKQRSMVTTCTA